MKKIWQNFDENVKNTKFFVKVGPNPDATFVDGPLCGAKQNIQSNKATIKIVDAPVSTHQKLNNKNIYSKKLNKNMEFYCRQKNRFYTIFD